MNRSGIKFSRTVQEILHDYQLGILKSESQERVAYQESPADALPRLRLKTRS